MTMKSVSAGEYTAPPADGPRMRLICGITPEAATLRRKISANCVRAATPSWMRAPPPSLMPMSGHAGAQREVHDLGDLLAVHLAERAAEHREVLGVDRHGPAVDRAVPDDDAVARDALLLEAEVHRPVLDERVDLGERALVEQGVDALAGGLLASRVLLVGGCLLRGVAGAAALGEVGELGGCGAGAVAGVVCVTRPRLVVGTLRVRAGR